MRLMDMILFATIMLFVCAAVLQLSQSLPGAEHGLLLFEKACPIHYGAS